MTIRNFTDFDVYKLLYECCLIVHQEIIPNLPKEEKFYLQDQINRACKSPLALIAEGYARKDYLKDWKRYLDEAMGECNEMIVHLSLARDLYLNKFKEGICQQLIDKYTIAAKQLYTLGRSWKKYE